MSLPSSYSAILSDLNREVLRAQPSDPLQFCANWFASRLEQERTQSRSSTSGLEAPHLGPIASTSSSGSARAKPSALPFNQSYSFGGQSRFAQNEDLPSPSSEHPPSSVDPTSPFSRDRAANPAVQGARSSGHIKSGSTVASDAAAASAAARARLPSTDEDSDVEDPRDDPNYHPARAGGPFGPSGASGSAPGGIPAAYNLGRRTSVSAESLDPSVHSSLPKTVIPKTPSQRARIEASIANNLLFRNLDEDQHNDVLNAMKEVTVQAGTEVIVQGAVGDFFYVVEEGSFEVWVRGPPTHEYTGPGQSKTHPGDEKKVATYGPGGSFGELALMYNAPRAATVVATSRSTMWALDRVTFRSILVEHTSRKRKMYENFLGEVPILQTLNPKERAKIADALEEKVYEEGEAVVIEGEVGKNFYIIESGSAEVTKKRKNGLPGGTTPEEDVLGVLGKGDYFGELALINSAPRAATVRAIPGKGRLRVATLGEKAFTRLLGPIIDILARKAERSYGPGAAVNASIGGGGPGNGGPGSASGVKESFGQGEPRRSVPVEGASHAAEPSSINESDLAPSETAGYKIGEKKTLNEYNELDKDDESLQKWKASLGLGASGSAADGPNVSMLALKLVSPSRPQPIVLDLTNPEALKGLKKDPVVIKEGAEYAVELVFRINNTIVSGLRYIQAVKRAGIVVDKMESMIGSYGPSADNIEKRFVTEEAPSGMIARSGTYNVRSRVTDDDKTIYIDFEWSFVLKKEWSA
ncbi:hypothetical protein JCM16303_002997 [Sporobolomyces ruberrimus]